MPRLRVARPAGRNRDRGEDTTGVLGSPRQSAEAAVFDELRRSEYGRLDAGGHVYLDYTGAGLYAHSQLAEHLALLRQGVFGNPHSLNPTSAAMTELVEQARAAVLEFFRASPEEYVAIFTPKATGALRLVGEAYPFHAGDRFLLTFDNHNSVNGIREFARARGAETTYVPSEAPELRVDDHLLPRYLTEVVGEHNNLFAYPAQSNFSGVQHPLAWIEQAQAHGWDVLLDAAAYVPTNRLDLSRSHPDFVALSFYKMFGWPDASAEVSVESPAAHHTTSAADGRLRLPVAPDQTCRASAARPAAAGSRARGAASAARCPSHAGRGGCEQAHRTEPAQRGRGTRRPCRRSSQPSPQGEATPILAPFSTMMKPDRAPPKGAQPCG
jgi:hypothetical protein